jgi:cytochrome c oxidase cbb3-type subunit 3
MSDFFSGGWSLFITVVTLLGLAGCLWLLFVASKRTAMAADNSTGHVFDEDLVEMNNPLPRWWMVLFILTIVFGLAYLLLYPGLGSNAGQLGWTSRAEYETEQVRAQASMGPVYARFAAMPAAALAHERQAMAIGERLFINNCAACHGADGKGNQAIGAPNLTDKVWLHGWGEEAITAMVNQGKTNVMPPQGGRLSPEQIHVLAAYVWNLSQPRQTAAR